eukprot:m.114663 g.114663  ORF g.114663 m.114663 type:complete len:507 (+) comp17119_c0_seq1:172-1692(+)
MASDAQDAVAVAEAGDTMTSNLQEGKSKRTSKSHSMWFPGMPLGEKKAKLVAQLRERLVDHAAELETEEKMDVHILEKYLNARQWNLDKTEAMFKFSNDFRTPTGEFSADALMAWDPPLTLLRYTPAGVYGEDKDGNPLAWSFMGRSDPAGVYRLASKRIHRKWRFYELMRMTTVPAIMTRQRGKYVGQFTMVLDLKGLGMHSAYMPYVRIFNECNKLAQQVYPELIRHILILNPPSIFKVVFALVRPFLMERVVEKIRVIRGSPLAGLSEYIDVKYIPAMYGGEGPDPDETGEASVQLLKQHKVDLKAANGSVQTMVDQQGANKDFKWEDTLVDGKMPVTMSGKVPAELFVDIGDGFEDAEKATVAAGGVHTVDIEIKSSGSVLCWDFMSKAKDVGFKLEYSSPANAAAAATESKKKQKGKQDREVIVALERYDCHVVPESNNHICTQTGVYHLVFDNSYSWMRSKQILYKVVVQDIAAESKDVDDADAAALDDAVHDVSLDDSP